MGLTGVVITHNCTWKRAYFGMFRSSRTDGLFISNLHVQSIMFLYFFYRFCFFAGSKVFIRSSSQPKLVALTPFVVYRLQTLVSGSNLDHKQKIRTDTVTTRKLDKKHTESRTCSLFCFFTSFWRRSIYVSRWFRTKPSTYLQFLLQLIWL